MKAWLKGGLIGGVIGLIYPILMILYFAIFELVDYSPYTSWELYIYVYFAWAIPSVFVLFPICAFIGWIVGKVKSRKQEI